MTTSTKSETAAKKDVTKLQRAIVDGLEDVKAQDIQVFNTEHLSPLFERVIVASGTSNRQTKALAASVRDAVKEAGFTKPRIEGEDNGEWIIVDCGAAVAHIMQPAIRQYYRLEELWGDTPVRLKLGAAKPVSSAATDLAEKKSAQKAAKSDAKAAGKATAKKAAAPAVPARSGKATVKAVAKTAAKSAAAPAKSAAKPAAKTTAKAPAKAITKAPAKTPAKSSSAKAAPTKAPAKPATAARKPAATKAPIKTVVVKPSASRSKAAVTAKTGAKPAPARGGAAAKPAAKRVPGRK
ncbi:ribosome-associated protein [Acidovorax sp. 93]|uniref:ribosome silencing factor n=1 Tax=Acidovorax sp. 93 TaxID=2135632 RepID=UPI000EB604FD|nr:ribosome silencing factor [Acidovorax sp. 93]RKR25937.1 ribosome-associated protein [Acidovorax sp. 93]